MKNCGFSNCSNTINSSKSGAKIGYTINNLNKEVHACQECAYKIMVAPRGSWHVTKFKELKPTPSKAIIIT